MEKVEKDIIRKITKVDNIFKIPTSSNMEILFDVNENEVEEPFQKEIKERSELMKILEKEDNKNYIYTIIKNKRIIDYYQKIIFKMLSGDDNYKQIFINNYNKNDIKKYNNIYFTSFKNIEGQYKMMSNSMTKYYDSTIFKLFECLKLSYKNLNKGGSCLFNISIPNINIINFIYFLTFLFDEVYILNKFIIFSKGFKNDIGYYENINKIIKNNYNFNIIHKKDEKKLIKYFKNLIKINTYYKKKLIINKDINSYIFYEFCSDFNLLLEVGSIYHKEQTYIKKYLQQIFKKQYSNKINLINNNNNDIYINNFYSMKMLENKINKYKYKK